MPLFDLPLAELEGYRPEVREPADFDASWAATLDRRGRAQPSSTAARWTTGSCSSTPGT